MLNSNRKHNFEKSRPCIHKLSWVLCETREFIIITTGGLSIIVFIRV